MPNSIDALSLIRQNYVDYSKYTMQYRVYPSIYDGLKLAQRRTLYAAYADTPATSKTKLSTLTGAAMKYHPHSEATDVIVKMAGEYQSSFPLYQTQGNYGDMFGNPASAPRYLELCLNNAARKMYFSRIDEAPFENFEVTAEPLYLPTLFPLALIQGCYSIGQGTPNVLIPELEVEDLKDFILNYIQTGETRVTLDNFVRPTDYNQLSDAYYKDECVMSLLNKGKGTLIYEPQVELIGNQIIISNLYVLAQFPTLVDFLKDAIEDDKVDVRDESTTERVWVVEKVKYHSFDMASWAEKIKKKFTYRENYAMYFCDEVGAVRPYSLGEVIEICYGKYKEACLKQFNRELESLRTELSILRCLADIAEVPEALDIVIDNKLEDNEKSSRLSDMLPEHTTEIIDACLQKPIRYLKADYKAIDKVMDKIAAKERDISDIDDTIYDIVDKLKLNDED